MRIIKGEAKKEKRLEIYLRKKTMTIKECRQAEIKNQ